jgi:hypothetical protein
MTRLPRRLALSLLAATAIPFAPAMAADCPTAGASALTLGTVAPVAARGDRAYRITLGAGEGVIVDLAGLVPKASSGDEEHDHEGEGGGGSSANEPQRKLRLCDSAGKLLAPQPGEVFEKGGSVTQTDDGERLRFVADRAGQFIIAVGSDDAAREILVRRRDVGVAQPAIVPVALDSTTKGITTSTAPMMLSFTAPAGTWVELKSTSEKDTVLRLAGPDREGGYAKIAENDDSDGLNPRIRRNLRVAGTYYVQVDSLASEPGEFEFSLKRIAAPKSATPLALRAGQAVAGKLADADDVRMYGLSVTAGHSYRLDLTAPYDGVVAIGVSDPVESEDGDDSPFAEIRSKDENTTGTERLSFTARSNGTLLVRIKSFGIGESDGGFTLTANDLGI